MHKLARAGSLLKATLVIALALTLVGCTRWTVVQQASPNPFPGLMKLHLEPVSFEGMMVQDREEAEFLAERDEEGRQRWLDDKRKVAETYLSSLRDEAEGYQVVQAPASDAISVRSHVTNMHGGVSLGFTSSAARIEMTVQLFKDGKLADEIVLAGEASQSEGISIMGVDTSGYSGSDRLGQAAEKLGDAVADYVDERVHP
jgi:hypothetical protein